MRSNCRGIPKDLLAKKLKRHEYVAKESKDGLTVLKWKDKHDVLLYQLSTLTKMLYRKEEIIV